jgi:diacylglycerol O-acyltransferase/trehalose O-mycolyltransferase
MPRRRRRTGHYVVRPEDSHTWGLFESEMQESCNTTIGPALGA